MSNLKEEELIKRAIVGHLDLLVNLGSFKANIALTLWANHLPYD